MYEDPKSKISQLEKVLEAREDRVSGRTKRHELHEKDVSVNQDWDDSEFKVGEEITPPVFEKSKTSSSTNLPIKILIGSIIFFILAISIAAYKFIGGGNIVSGDNIIVTIKAPVSISGGQVLPFEIEIKNNNNITLSGVDMSVNFPAGTKQALDTAQSVERMQQFLGDINPGQSLKKNLSVALFGLENEKKEIKINLEYKVAGSNSLFTKAKSFIVLISSSPVNIIVTSQKEVNTNQNVDFSIEVTSNSPTVMKNLLLKAEYPFGFSFGSSDPKTYSKNNLWLIGDLEPGAKRVIKFSGVLNGQEGEERGFNFSVGAQSKSDATAVDIPYSSFFSSVTIRRPFVSADIFLDGVDTTEYISASGEKIEAVIKWQNNLPYEVSDVSMIVKLSGNALNKSAVQVDGGFYRSFDNTVTFDKATDSTLASLQPGQIGENKFNFGSFTVGSVTGAGLINPTISLDISVKGKRVGYESGQAYVLFSDSRKVKITSDPRLFAKILYYVGPFQNTGPIPPTAEKETSYTVTWTVTNPLNNISGAQVSAILPSYIKWLSSISPTTEKINYDQSTGLVTWNIGNIPAGAGTVLPAKEVSFQVSFLPSVSQIDTAPKLIGDATLTAKDNFTLTPVSSSFMGLDTRLSNDPYFRPESETVIQ